MGFISLTDSTNRISSCFNHLATGAATTELIIIMVVLIDANDTLLLDKFQTALQAASTTSRCEIQLRCVEVTFSDLVQHLVALYRAATHFNPRMAVDIIPVNAAGSPLTPEDKSAKLGFCTYAHVALGGTFDRMHNGHRLLLTTSALHSTERIRVGVAINELLAKKQHASLIQPVDERVSAVREFLQRVTPEGTALDIFPMDEFTGGTTTLASVNAIVVSPETQPAAVKINDTRAANSLPPLAVLVIEYVENHSNLGDDFKLSSGSLRAQDAAANAVSHSDAPP
eukprot:NODE_2853_length_1105_cov_47.929924_g2617_i0.p1 GENE.NODE_2853_length_1105_cov_47.929924_g2617_i0~~NODE_2853_length_1105_cov_47.929924_g2617_i0.p1  ORF type:complete len:284 (+),score=51.98 NODE_2853_length_1105_cov_47.929924_g2617_i0:141-992(+)